MNTIRINVGLIAAVTLVGGVLIAKHNTPSPTPTPVACPVIKATYSGPMVKDCEFATPCIWRHHESYQTLVRDKLAQLRSTIRLYDHGEHPHVDGIIHLKPK